MCKEPILKCSQPNHVMQVNMLNLIHFLLCANIVSIKYLQSWLQIISVRKYTFSTKEIDEKIFILYIYIYIY